MSARSLVEEAQREERAGQPAAARASYQRALELAGGEPALLADLHRWIGRTFTQEGDFETARQCAERSLRVAEQGGSQLGVAHAINFLGTLCQQRGALDEAEELYRRATEHARRAGAEDVLATLQLNLGVIANIRGDLGAALERYRESLVGLKRFGHHHLVISALNNLGMVLTDLERWAEAKAAYDEALQFCMATDNTGLRVVVEVNRAEMLVEQGEFAEAEQACHSAHALMRELGDLRAAGDLYKLQGIIDRDLGQFAAAEEHFQVAARHADEREDLLLAAEVAREQAVLFWRQKRSRETLVALNRAHQRFDRLRARRDLADVDGKLANLEATFEEIVRLWGESIESADRYTQGHCVRVARYACALARAAGMDEQTLFWFRLGALIHDVGKIVVPAEVLNKPGGFTPQERFLMERHPDAGVELLEGIEFPWDIRPMVRFHHERWGGGGYPTGIGGEEIPLSARILTIVDVFDALATDRPYRKAFPVARCVEIMRDEMADFFDPALLSLWEGLVERGEAGLEASDVGARCDATEPDVEPGLPLRVLYVPAEGADQTRAAVRPVRTSGLVVTHCGSRSDAEQLLSSERMDAMLVEISDRLDSEFDFLHRLRVEFPETALLVVGSLEDEVLALRSIQAGAHEYLAQPQLASRLLDRVIRRAIERNRVQQELHNRSMFDELTGVYNRRGLFAVGQQHLRLAQRTGRELFLLFADVDDMKQINDRFGHAEGDRALRDVARLLQQCFRTSDVIARIGGDEFVVLILEASAAGVPFITRRLDELLQGEALAERAYPLSVSFGLARYDAELRPELEELLARADQAMYEEKRRRAGERGEGPGGPSLSVIVV